MSDDTDRILQAVAALRGDINERFGDINVRFDDIIVLSKATYIASASRLDIEYTFIQGGKIETRPSSSYVFTVAELTRMLGDAGFEVLSLNGGFADERYELGSPRLVLTAKRL